MPEPRRRLPRPTYANIASTLALVAACSGTAVAVAPHLGQGSVGPRELAPQAVRAQHLADGAVGDRQVRAGGLSQSRVRGLVPRLRGPLPTGVARAGRIQATGQGLALVTVTGAPAAPARYPDVPPVILQGFAPPYLRSVASATSTATCPAGTVALSGGVATSPATGTVPGTFTRDIDPGSGTYPGTWSFSASPGGVSLDQERGTVTVTAAFTGVFDSPQGSPGGWFTSSPRATYQRAPADPYPQFSMRIAGFARPVPGLAVQAVAYCLELTPGA